MGTYVNAASEAIPHSRIMSSRLLPDQKNVSLQFDDGSKFRFSGLWLRDACRDEAVVSATAGERYLDKIPFATKSCGAIQNIKISPDAQTLQIDWADDSKVASSSFKSGFLRQYAPSAALNEADTDGHVSAVKDKYEWLKPYTGFLGTMGPEPHMLSLWKGGHQVYHMDFRLVQGSDANNLEMMQVLMREGLVVLDNVPGSKDNSTVLNFANNQLGGMQKDPARDDPNWVIQAKELAQSVSYAQVQRLNNHTDQSIPAHGIPALLLVVHYVQGSGYNTFTDTYAVAKAMKERDPRAFELLSTLGNNQERDFVRSRVDSVQEGTQGMLIPTNQPIIQVDAAGNIIRAQYNEVFRTPSTIPYHLFEEWYKAYLMWNDMIHGEEFEVSVKLEQGQMLVLNNWRVLHGRAGRVSSSDRVIMGGTVVREAFYSRAISLMGASYPQPDAGAAGLRSGSS